MIRTEKTIVIKRPVEDVFNYMAEFENDMEWRSELAEIRRTTEFGRNAGARYEQRLTWGGGEAMTDFEITDFKPYRHIEFRGTSGDVQAHGIYDFEAEDGTTRVKVAAEVQVSGALKLSEPLIEQALSKQGASDLDHLKDILESRP